MQQYCIILTTTNEKQVVNKIINNLLKMNLSACIQVDNIISHFKWEGTISSAKEYRIMIKARSDNYVKIENVIVTVHNYELPQIIKLNITGGLQLYLDWLTQGS